LIFGATFLDPGRSATALQAGRDMEQNPPPQFPSPEELKTKITEFMKQNFGDRVSVAAFAEPEPAAAEDEEKSEKIQEFEFNLLPRDIKAHLDRFVIKQEEAKKVEPQQQTFLAARLELDG
jgi:hypothetical protein